MQSNNQTNDVLELLVEALDIPPSHYQKAADRYRSLDDWLHREQSAVAGFDPQVYPQGSFRYGTVIRPLGKNEEYDLDIVSELALSKTAQTQEQLKNLVGQEIKKYGEANSMKEPAEEKPRCWRLNYSDDVNFHMDILPAIPEDDGFKAMLRPILRRNVVPEELADLSVAITDKKHQNYSVLSNVWPSSNPKGFAEWFEGKMRAIARIRAEALVQKAIYASVKQVPAYEWKTPLQRAIQILKRHRDVMFRKSPDTKPISMIITTLSAHAYRGESELHAALSNIIEGMPQFVREDRPRIPNPVNPDEDFADKWAKDSTLEDSFWAWHKQVGRDLACIDTAISKDELYRLGRDGFALELSDERLKAIVGAPLISTITPKAPKPITHIATPRPWSADA
jgi:hypothetical protein